MRKYMQAVLMAVFMAVSAVSLATQPVHPVHPVHPVKPVKPIKPITPPASPAASEGADNASKSLGAQIVPVLLGIVVVYVVACAVSSQLVDESNATFQKWCARGVDADAPFPANSNND